MGDVNSNPNLAFLRKEVYEWAANRPPDKMLTQDQWKNVTQLLFWLSK